MQDAGREWLGAVRQAPFSSSTFLSLSSAMQRQLFGDPTGFKPLSLPPPVLIAKHPKLPFLVSSQPVRARQPV